MISITKLLMDTPNFGDSLRYQPHAHKATNGVGAGRGPVVVWNCTKTCNLKCVHCYARSEAIKYQNELTHEEGIKLIDQLADFHVPVILFSGGEPLLRNDFLQIAQALADAGISIDDIGTNASLVTDELLDALEAMGHHPQFNISFDGLGHHDWLRGVSGAEEHTLEAIQLLKRRGYRVKVQYCLWDGNLDTLRETTLRLAEMGVDHLRPIRVVEAPRWKAAEYGHTLDYRAYCDLMVEYLDWYAGEDLPMELEVWSLFDYMPASRQCRLTPVKRCSVARDRLQPVCGDARSMPFVASNGSLTLCNQISGWEVAHDVEHGNVYKTPLAELLSDSPFTQQLLITRAQVREHNPQCQTCEFAGVCNCGCRAVALAMTDDLLAADPTQCIFFKGGYRERFTQVLSDHGIDVW